MTDGSGEKLLILNEIVGVSDYGFEEEIASKKTFVAEEVDGE